MRFGYLGVGNMGQPMAGKLLDAGHELWVYDVREEAMRPLLERQARQAASAKELADTCDTVIVSLPTLEIFWRALSGPDGLLAGKALKTLVNTCTVGTPFVRKVETECAATGVTVIDAPISGGVVGSRGRYARRDGVRQSGQFRSPVPSDRLAGSGPRRLAPSRSSRRDAKQ